MVERSRVLRFHPTTTTRYEKQKQTTHHQSMAAESQEENVKLGLEGDPDEGATSFLNSWATAYETGVLDSHAGDGTAGDEFPLSTDYASVCGFVS
jgi:hypothetical protein